MAFDLDAAAGVRSRPRAVRVAPGDLPHARRRRELGDDLGRLEPAEPGGPVDARPGDRRRHVGPPTAPWRRLRACAVAAARRYAVGRDRRRSRVPHPRRWADVARRHAARLGCVEQSRDRRSVALRSRLRVHRRRPASAGRRSPVRLRHSRLRPNLAARGERDPRRQLRQRGARGYGAPRIIVRGNRDRRVRLVRRRRCVELVAEEPADRLGARPFGAPGRSGDRDARSRVLDPRRHRAAARTRRRRVAGCSALRAARRGSHSPLLRRSGSVAARSAGRREPAVRCGDRLRRATRRARPGHVADHRRRRQRAARLVQRRRRQAGRSEHRRLSRLLARSAGAPVGAGRDAPLLVGPARGRERDRTAPARRRRSVRPAGPLRGALDDRRARLHAVAPRAARSAHAGDRCRPARAIRVGARRRCNARARSGGDRAGRRVACEAGRRRRAHRRGRRCPAQPRSAQLGRRAGDELHHVALVRRRAGRTLRVWHALAGQ